MVWNNFSICHLVNPSKVEIFQLKTSESSKKFFHLLTECCLNLESSIDRKCNDTCSSSVFFPFYKVVLWGLEWCNIQAVTFETKSGVAKFNVLIMALTYLGCTYSTLRDRIFAVFCIIGNILYVQFEWVNVSRRTLSFAFLGLFYVWICSFSVCINIVICISLQPKVAYSRTKVRRECLLKDLFKWKHSAFLGLYIYG